MRYHNLLCLLSLIKEFIVIGFKRVKKAILSSSQLPLFFQRIGHQPIQIPSIRQQYYLFSHHHLNPLAFSLPHFSCSLALVLHSRQCISFLAHASQTRSGKLFPLAVATLQHWCWGLLCVSCPIQFGRVETSCCINNRTASLVSICRLFSEEASVTPGENQEAIPQPLSIGLF